MTARKKKTRKEQEKRSVTQAVTRKISRSQFSLNYLLHYVFGDGGMHLVGVLSAGGSGISLPFDLLP